MATVLLAAGNTAAQSANIVLAAGESATLVPTTPAGVEVSMGNQAFANVEVLDAGAVWRPFGFLSTVNGSQVLNAIGTFRINRPLQTNSIGVDRA